MKIISCIGAVAVFSGFFSLCQAQQAAQVTSLPPPTAPSIVSRAENERVWAWTEYEPGPNGQAIPKTHSYTEFASGLCFLTNGVYADSQEQITIQPDGSGAAIAGQHQAYFPGNIYNGVITLITPDGTQLQSSPIGLSYSCGSNSVLIAVLTNSIGELISSNQVLYPEALVGDVTASLLFTYTVGGLEQDVVIEEQPPAPENFNMNSTNSSLQMMTEFFNAPQPAVTGESDDWLGFGTMEMAPGKAFLLGTNEQDNGIKVEKSWVNVSGRQILVEQVPVMALADELSQLPPPQNPTAKARPASPLNVVSVKRLLPGPRPIRASHQPLLVAKTKSPSRGIVLDYVMLNSLYSNAHQPLIFQGDTTYYVSRVVLITGAGGTVIEGGSVIKYANNPSVYISIQNNLITPTNAYLPAIFTSMNDNSVGEPISGSTGNPTNTGAMYLSIPLQNLPTNATLSNLRFSYAGLAVAQASEGTSYSNSYPVWNCQFINCGTAIELSDSYNYNQLTLNLYNVLFSNCGTVLTNGDAYYDGEIKLAGQNITVDNANILVGTWTQGYIYDTDASASTLTNSILTGVQHQISYTGAGTSYGLLIFTNGCYFGSDTGIYQTAGAGNYYLATSSPCRNTGTATISPALWAELQQRTTTPPVVYALTNISSVLTLGPSVQRDTNSSPDMGYHHDPLDYIFGGCNVSNSLAFTAGTAVGWFETNGILSAPYAISLGDGASLSFSGNATQPCIFARYAMVQEDTNSITWTNSGLGGIVLDGSGNPSPQLSADFTKFTTDARINVFNGSSAFGLAGFLNSEFYGAGLSFYVPATFTNCLFFRDLTSFNDQYTNAGFELVNGTFYNGGVSMTRTNASFPPSSWTVVDTSFDGTDFSTNDKWNGTTNTLFNYNAYNTNNFSWTNYAYLSLPTNGTLEVVGPNDTNVDGYNWQSSWFGSFYLPTNSPLIEAGSTNAIFLGLYWFTTQTNQTIEGTSIVDIGYHYVATDTNGIPLDDLDPPTPNYIGSPDGPPLTFACPDDQTVMQGSDAIFSITATGVPPLSYQWSSNGVPLTDGDGIYGSESPTLTLSGVNTNQTGRYNIIVTDFLGVRETCWPGAELTVLPQTNDYDTPPLYLMPPYAWWQVTDISDPAQPVSIGEFEEPFGGGPDNLPYNTPWHTNLYIPVTEAYGTTSSGGTNGGYGTVFKIDFPSSVTNLHSFDGSDGAYPCSQLAESGSAYYGIPVTVYGTTSSGGTNDHGTVFKVNADGTGFTNLYEFTGGADGGNPQAGLIISGSTLYGTTTNSIFKINTDGSDFTCLINTNGASQLLLSLSGDILYGTTYSGGASNYGSVFSINTDGSDFTNIYNFDGGTNGRYPSSGLELYGIGSEIGIQSPIYALYGTTCAGGTNGFGIVYSVNTDGSGFSNLHDFNGTDGSNSVGGLLITNNIPGNLDRSGTWLFGTTSAGGTNGGGTVFGMNPVDGSGFETINTFPSGSQPEGRLAGVGGIIYGTTFGGGTNGHGTIFSISNDTDFAELYSFNGTNGGGLPLAGLTLAVVDNGFSIWSLDATLNASSQSASNAIYSIAIDNFCTLFANGVLITNMVGGGSWSSYYPLAPGLNQGQNDIRAVIAGDQDFEDYFAMAVKSTGPGVAFTNLFGTTDSGNPNSGTSAGTLFEIFPDGYETNLYAFLGPPQDGANPIGDLVLSGNTLYGVTEEGGTNGPNYDGTIFSFTLGSTTNVLLHNFTDTPDGANPAAGLVLSGTNLYGTTESGGASNDGTIFRINTDGSGYTNLYSFNGGSDDGAGPQAGLLLVSNTLYGTTSGQVNDNTINNGTVFSIHTDGSGYTNLYSFAGGTSDGTSPQGGLELVSNTLYGTTFGGGADNLGTIFSFTLGSTTNMILYSFTGGNNDGAGPQAGLLLVGDTLYGTTSGRINNGTENQGTIFSIGTSIGANGYGYTNLVSFGGSDTDGAEYPEADLIILGGSLYGTTQNDSFYNHGVVFNVSTNGTGFNDLYDFGINSSDGYYPQGGLCSP